MTASTYADVTGEARDFITLLKPRVMVLVVFTGIAGMVLAPGHINPILGLIAIACIALASGGAGAVNMWFDRDIDAIMTRTLGRPIPTGKIEPEAALAFGTMAIFAACSTMGLALNWTAAGLLAGAGAFYVFIYTIWLKRRTPHNIVIGGAAGAFPPVIGWAAVTGHADWQPWLLFLLVFLWTPPHFWALALYKSEDYRRAGVPMLPVVSGPHHTKIQMLIYTLLLIPAALSPYFAHIAGIFYLGAATILSGLFLLCAVRVLVSHDDKPAKQMFAFSILYLFFDLRMSDSKPDPLGPDPLADRIDPPTPDVDLHAAVEYAKSRRLRGRNIALFLALLLWVFVVYIAFMVKIHTELHP